MTQRPLLDVEYPRIIAVIDPAACTDCGICVACCPHGAISYIVAVQVDDEQCTGCGVCVHECPRGALTVKTCDSVEAPRSVG